MNDEDSEHHLRVPDSTPANDRAAHVLRWVGLIAGLCLCAIGIVAALN
jgi:hypothetical protein